MITTNLGYFGQDAEPTAAATPPVTRAAPRPSRQPWQQSRIPFHRPTQAGFTTPRIPPTAFFTHLSPFMNVLPPWAAQAARGIPYQPDMRPGMAPPAYGSRGGAPAAAPGVIPGPRPTAPGVARGRGAGNGNTFARGVSPYRVLRTGMFPRVSYTPGGYRAGVTDAGALIRRLTPGAYTDENVPAGGYRY